MIKDSLLEVLATRASVELARVATVRPALGKRCERAEGILARHVAAPRAGVIRARVRGGELVGYLVRGSGGAVYRVEAKGSWRCSCPDHHGRHRRGARAHGRASTGWRAGRSGGRLRGHSPPEVTAAAEELERRHSEAPAGETRAA